MSFPFFMARRYLFSKKKRNAINIISGISVGGVSLATMALICVLSGFNGFRELVGSFFTSFNPQLEVTSTRGKFVETDDATLAKLKAHPDIASASATYTDHALILFRGRPTVITLKGVDDAYIHTTQIKDILYGEGHYTLHRAGIDYGIPGYGLAAQMGTTDFGTIEICAPKPGERINLANPIENINVQNLSASRICFQVHQAKYDNNYMLTSLAFAQKLFDKPKHLTTLELRLKEGTDEAAVQKELQVIAGDKFRVKNRFEQQEETFQVMQIEKLFAFAFLAFILLVAIFNIIGSLSMLIIDKKNDVGTLRTLGATDRDIAKIFLFEGRLIAVLGGAIGVVLGLILCGVQQQFGLLKLGSGDNFIINAYPVTVHATDVVLVFFTVVAMGFLTVWWPVKYMCNRLLNDRH